jgi:hypothetical protein
MKNGRYLFIFGIMIFSLTRCEKNEDDPYIPDNNQRIIFQCEYINYAWGYQHVGWIIDSSGSVYCYNNPEVWYYTDSLGLINSTEMDSNLLRTDSICYKIDKVELTSKIALIKKASKGNISEQVNEMFDAGATTFYTYIYDEETKSYKQILLKQTGDWRIDNTSTEAVELYEWLSKLFNQINQTEK